jgi:hypothetical protein
MPCAGYKLKIYFASFAELCVFARTCSVKFYPLVSLKDSKDRGEARSELLVGPFSCGRGHWPLSTKAPTVKKAVQKSKAASIKLTLAAVGLDAFKNC